MLKHPHTNSNLWDHQNRALAFLAEHNAALLDMAMGTGKTRVAIEHVRRLNLSPILVLSPKTVVAVWREQIARWAPDMASKFVLVGYELAIARRDQYFAKSWPVVILDESHRIKAIAGTTSKLCAKLTVRSQVRLCLSGTPMAHSPMDIFAQARFLDPTIFGRSFVRFQMRYAVLGIAVPPHLRATWREKLLAMPTALRAVSVQLLNTKSFRSGFREGMRDLLVAWLDGGHGQSPWSVKQWNALSQHVNPMHLKTIVGWRNLEEFREKLASFSFRVRVEDAIDLPDVLHVRVAVELEGAQLAAYQAMEQDFVAWLQSGIAVTAANTLDRLGKLMQIIGGALRHEVEPNTSGDKVSRRTEHFQPNAKEEALTELLEGLPPEEPVVVFALYRADIEAVHRATKRAGRKSAELSGVRSEFAEWTDAAQGDASHEAPTVLVAQVRSGGLGISMVRARHCVLYSLGFSLGDYEQALARVHRPGQERNVVYHHLVAVDTVDEKRERALRARKDAVLEVLGELGRC